MKTVRTSRVAGKQPLNQILGAAGYTAAEAEEALRAGRVAVNGKIARSGRLPVDPSLADIAIDGTSLRHMRRCRYIAFHKPYQVLSSFSDPERRATVSDYVPVKDVYAVGRLDYDSEGLMLLSDDGWLNHRLTHPRYDHPKVYWAQVEGVPGEDAVRQLITGVTVKGQRTRPAEVRLLTGALAPKLPPRTVPIRYRVNVPTTWLEIVLREGKKRQVRHMTAAVGHPTLRLLRVAIGPIELGSMEPGEWRYLNDMELAKLASVARGRPGR